jgi:beta-alanine degradation protein BauB
MRHRLILLAPLLIVTASASGQDPAVTDAGKYNVILGKESTRVLEYRDRPSEKTNQHRHPESVLYALSAFDRGLQFPDSTSRTHHLKTGDVFFLPAQTHIGENIGSTDRHACR